jgi:pyruvate formate lyase activating enzyme
MKIGAVQKLSLIDYPNEICAIIFTLGCNFRCPYCHNPELVNMNIQPIEENEILSFLQSRKGKLSAVSITGGEPTLHNDLPKFISKIKSFGFKVKLDTNGTNPQMLKNLIDKKLIDYAAMDIKAPLLKYESVVCSKIDANKIKMSINIIKNSNIDYEFRTTVVHDFITKEDIEKITLLIKDAKLYCIQNFIPSKTLDRLFKTKHGYSESELEQLKNTALKNVKECIVR